jgi:2-keto-4-pentenoate hydratase/2-oxohepta-3-ene-1,7-dioic acid hydratase in catechol pathway
MTDTFVRAQLTDEPPFYARLEDNRLKKLTQPPWYGITEAGESIERDKATLLAPVEPTKIVCIGLNYHEHVKASYSADEAPERPLIFLKPPSSIIGPGEDIIHPSVSQRVDYEAELGVVMGSRARNITEAQASDHIFGLTCVNDVTARDLQKPDGQWSRAKGFDTFCPVGPWIVGHTEFDDLLVEGVLNDEVKQSGRTIQMIFKIPFLVSYISSIMTLMPGDLISTGTPSGISPMKPGDKIEVRVQNVGTLTNYMAR